MANLFAVTNAGVTNWHQVPSICCQLIARQVQSIRATPAKARSTFDMLLNLSLITVRERAKVHSFQLESHRPGASEVILPVNNHVSTMK